MGELLTPEQAAARLDMCERTLRKLRQTGEIAYIAVTGRKFRYTPEDCDAFLAERRRKEAPCPSAKIQGRRTSNTTSKSTSAGFMALRTARRNATLNGTKPSSARV